MKFRHPAVAASTLNLFGLGLAIENLTPYSIASRIGDPTGVDIGKSADGSHDGLNSLSDGMAQLLDNLATSTFSHRKHVEQIERHLNESNESSGSTEGAAELFGTSQRTLKHKNDAWNDFLKNGREPRRNWQHVPVDYNGQHPFERKLQQTQQYQQNLNIQQTRKSQHSQHAHSHNVHDEYFNQNERNTQRNPITTYSNMDTYQSMRVQFDTHLLDALIAGYPAHVSYVRNVLLPSLRKFWAETLSIVPASQISIPLDGQCARDVKKLSGYDLDDFLQFDTTEGFARSITNIGNNVNLSSDNTHLVYDNKDLIVIVLPVEGTSLCPDSTASFDLDGESTSSQLQTLAFATNCQNDQLDRPTVGYTGICFSPMDPDDRSSATHQRRLLTIAHEFTHILGMNSYDFPYFYNHKTQLPRTPRDTWNRPPSEQKLCVDGTREYVEVAEEGTLRGVTTSNGYVAYEVVTETVRNVVRNQFDCRQMMGARLENQPTGDADCFGSHWDHRLFNNEFMAAVYTGSTQYVTALTLALLEDSGWYMPDYSAAQNSPFGKGAGCEFVNEKCIQNGRVPKWASGTYCTSASTLGCTPDKRIVAYCDISKWDGNLPSGYQYFQDPTTGGGLQQSDFCPAFTTIFRFEIDSGIQVLDCTDPSLNSAWVKEADEVFGESSRCIDHSTGARPSCLNVMCGEEGEYSGKVVLVVGGGRKLACSYTGEVLRLPSGKEVICPSFEQTCPESVCKANCAGRGACDYSITPAQCECFDRSDSSPFCSSSPWSFAPTTSPAPTQSTSPTAPPTITPQPTETFITGSTMSGAPSHQCTGWFRWATVMSSLFWIFSFGL